MDKATLTKNVAAMRGEFEAIESAMAGVLEQSNRAVIARAEHDIIAMEQDITFLQSEHKAWLEQLEERHKTDIACANTIMSSFIQSREACLKELRAQLELLRGAEPVKVETPPLTNGAAAE